MTRYPVCKHARMSPEELGECAFFSCTYCAAELSAEALKCFRELLLHSLWLSKGAHRHPSEPERAAIALLVKRDLWKWSSECDRSGPISIHASAPAACGRCGPCLAHWATTAPGAAPEACRG